MVHISADARLVDPLIEELAAQLGLGVQDLGHEVLQVHDLDALVAKDLREGVMLLLGHGKERDVVEQQLFQGVRGEVQQLVAGAVKDDLLEVADLAFDVYSLHRSSPRSDTDRNVPATQDLMRLREQGPPSRNKVCCV